MQMIFDTLAATGGAGVLVTLTLVALAVVAMAQWVVGAVPTPQDASLLLQDTTTKTASFDSAALDLGSGFAPGGLGMPAAAVVDVTAADRANSDETYNFKLQESADGSTGWTDCGVAAAVPVAGAVATLGAVVAKGFINKRFVRLSLVAAGTTPSITYKAYLNTTIQR